MRVLLSAYSCEPNRGSELGVGWNWALQAARFHETWVITRMNSRSAIEDYLTDRPVSNLHFVYHDLPGCRRYWSNSGRGIRLYYVLWQLSVLPIAARLQRTIGFDAVHHVTMVPIDVPGLLWCLRTPFFWGPVGGGQEPSPVLRHYFGRSWSNELVRIAQKRFVRFNPLVRLAVRRAHCIVVANSDTQRRLEQLGAKSLVRESEIGIRLPAITRHHEPTPSECPFTILWAGRLIPLKAPFLALDVLAELRRRGIVADLIMAGDGPLKQRIERRMKELDLGENVRLLGAVPFTGMERFYATGDVFLFSSLRETSGTVLLEAMAHELPVVSLDQHGAKDIVSQESGIKVPINDARQVVMDLATALQRLATDHGLRQRMGIAARQRVAEVYSWEHKGDLLRNLYSSCARTAS